MRHRRAGKKLNRNTKTRKALFKNLLTDFFLLGSLITTEVKAKAIKGKIDRLITKAKNPSLVNQRFIYAYLSKPLAASKLINEIAPRFIKRNGGYSRVLKLGSRRGDQALMAKIELVSSPEEIKETTPKEKVLEPKKKSKEKSVLVSKKPSVKNKTSSK